MKTLLNPTAWVNGATQSPTTTLFGLGTIAWAVGTALRLLTDGDPATMPNWNDIIPQIALGLAAIRAQESGLVNATDTVPGS